MAKVDELDLDTLAEENAELRDEVKTLRQINAEQAAKSGPTRNAKGDIEMEFNGVGISAMPDDRLLQSLGDVQREAERRGLRTSASLAPGALAEAVEYLEMEVESRDANVPGASVVTVGISDLRTLLSHARAQQPGLTEEQRTLLREAVIGLPYVARGLGKRIKAAFPAAFK